MQVPVMLTRVCGRISVGAVGGRTVQAARRQGGRRYVNFPKQTLRKHSARYPRHVQAAHFSSGTQASVQLNQVFETTRAEGRPAFIAYVTAGFPSEAETIDALEDLQAGGADIIEIGVPFTDPLADGPTIQKANQVALNNGIDSVRKCIEIARVARERGVTVPFVFMGYSNPLLTYEGDLMQDCVDVGVTGFIVVDMPPEEAVSFRDKCAVSGLSFVPLVAPTTTDARLQALGKLANGFVYAVSVTGVTGARTQVNSNLPQFVQNINKSTTADAPVCVGFGIGNNEQFSAVSKIEGVGGVVVGSAIVKHLESVHGEEREKRRDSTILFCRTLTGRDTVSDYLHNTQANVNFSAHTGVGDISVTGGDLGSKASMFGDFGGSYVPETLVSALDELQTEYLRCKDDPAFRAEVESYNEYIGRPSSFHKAERLTEHAGGATIWLKREDLNHTGAHKINNACAQALLAKRLGKTRIICETGAGQHGVATATMCAKLGLPLTVYMGAQDCERQQLNVFRMQLLGATVCPVDSGSRTLKDAINEAMRDWVTNIKDTHYLVGSAIGPHPFPTIVRDFQCVIGEETRRECLKELGGMPDAVVACVGGGSNAIGMFYPFINDKSVRLVGVEAGGDGVETGRHSAPLTAGTPGVLHGTRTYLMQDTQTGQIGATKSISAGLDYPGVGPEHSFLKDIGRAEYMAVTDEECLKGFIQMSKMEGIIPALETAHAVYATVELAKTLPKTANIVLNVSGRGDKDVDSARKLLMGAQFGHLVTDMK